ncbi:hypothetical protein B0H16DRAFT_1856679 [Mycena metata]|uniref:Uncharacterized protein n=1 Tax=Mycena metata TaxID=1033252 RepID=A0AAD7N4F3_9AGAR|nr:hypothetical protein B0H16DRAFT_1856679 [Mycena metata]
METRRVQWWLRVFKRTVSSRDFFESASTTYMDPLPLNGLLVTEDWDGFNPDKKGFISPQEAEFETTGGSDIKIPIQQLGDQCYVRKSARFLAYSRVKRISALRLSVRKEAFTPPLPRREIDFLKSHVGNAESSYSVTGSEIELLGDTKKRIKEQCAKALDKLEVADGAPLVTTTLEKLEVFPSARVLRHFDGCESSSDGAVGGEVRRMVGYAVRRCSSASIAWDEASADQALPRLLQEHSQ